MRLKTVRPELVALFNEVVTFRDCTVLCGVRSKTEQDRLFNIGRSKKMWPNSKHNVEHPADFAMAVDVAPYFADNEPPVIWPYAGQLKRDYAKECGLYYYFAGYVFAIADRMAIRIRWGGDWNGDGRYTDQSFDDLIHYELLGG